MAFRVELSPEALANLDAIASRILERGSFVDADEREDLMAESDDSIE